MLGREHACSEQKAVAREDDPKEQPRFREDDAEDPGVADGLEYLGDGEDEEGHT